MQIKLITSILLIGLLSLTLSAAQAAPDESASRADIVIVERNPSLDYVKNPMAEATASAIAQEIILQAMSLIGVRYKWGGNTPNTGLDCSGFIRYVFQQSTNVALPRTAHGMSQIGKVIDRDELQPGDLVFFNTLRRQFSHVGIYLGDNRFIHSPSTGKTITVDNLNQKYWVSRYNGARRLNRETIADSRAQIPATFAEEGAKPRIKTAGYRKRASGKMAQSPKTKMAAQSTTKQKKVTTATATASKKKSKVQQAG